MKLSEIEGAEQILEKLARIENHIDKLEDRLDNWVRWIIGLQMGTYVLLILAYFTHK